MKQNIVILCYDLDNETIKIGYQEIVNGFKINRTLTLTESEFNANKDLQEELSANQLDSICWFWIDVLNEKRKKHDAV